MVGGIGDRGTDPSFHVDRVDHHSLLEPAPPASTVVVVGGRGGYVGEVVNYSRGQLETLLEIGSLLRLLYYRTCSLFVGM